MALKALFLLFLSSALSISAFASGDQGGGEVNVTDEKGRKQGKWIFLGKDRPALGYPEDGKIEEGSYVDNRKEGLWIKYHNDGVTPKLKGEYKNNRPSGAYTKLYPDGTVKEVGVFSRNKYYDSLKRFHPNGIIEYEGIYNEEGKEQGTVKYYYANGQEEFVYEANDGIPTGKATRYYENGDIKEVIFYGEDGSVTKSEQKERVNPPSNTVPDLTPNEPAPSVGTPRTKGAKFQPNGYNKLYNENDEIWQDGEFRNGRLWDGKVYEYDVDGILLKVKVYKKGNYHSDGQL